jgi:23S rRNA pseudouridine1911/1915/1917 synthase
MTDAHDRDRSRLNQGWTYRDLVPQEADGLPVLEFYARWYPHSSAEVWRRRIEEGQVLLDGGPAHPEGRLRAGQQLAYHRPPWREAAVPAAFAVLHEDSDLIAVAKPAGLPTMPGGDFLENTLLFLVRQRYPDRPAPIHRLGRGTSGIVLFARSQAARRRLSADLRLGRLRKTYRTLVSGTDMEEEFAVDARIGLVPYPPLGLVHGVAPGGKPARTECRVLERRPERDQTLLEVDIPTGRPHQIRIHLAAAGHPLAGDPLYRLGGLPVGPPHKGRAPLPGDGGYHLHALRVRFAHPASGERLSIVCAPPELLRRALSGRAF